MSSRFLLKSCSTLKRHESYRLLKSERIFRVSIDAEEVVIVEVIVEDGEADPDIRPTEAEAGEWFSSREIVE